jgi:hypothetical protein
VAKSFSDHHQAGTGGRLPASKVSPQIMNAKVGKPRSFCVNTLADSSFQQFLCTTLWIRDEIEVLS